MRYNSMMSIALLVDYAKCESDDLLEAAHQLIEYIQRQIGDLPQFVMIFHANDNPIQKRQSSAL